MDSPAALFMPALQTGEMSFAVLPLYTADYLRDTRACSMAEHGAYLLLLIHCWDTREPVPLDEREAAGICNARSGDELEAMRRVLRRYFVCMEDGWYNRRMQLEIERSESIASKRRAAGLARHGLPASKCSANAEQVLSKCSASAEIDPVPYQAIIDLYHRLLPELPRCIKLSKGRRAAIRARWRGKDAEDLADWEAFFGLVRRSRFLLGLAPAAPGRVPFCASLDWLTKEANFIKVLEGRYE